MAKPAPALQLDAALEFMRVLWDLDNRLQSMSKRMLETIGVTSPQRLVVRMIGLRPGISAGELSSLLHLHKSTLTGILRRLEERRIIRRSSDPVDKRLHRFVLTTEGDRINRHKAGTIEARIRQTLTRLSEQEIATARHVLIALTQSLDDN